MSGPVRIIPLGGLGEVGKNITVIEHGDDLVLIDCGLTFPREEGMFGVDIVLPDYSYIEANADRLRAVVLTHGHEDHIGGLAWLMRQVRVPEVWATRFTLGLVKSRVDEFGLIGETTFREIDPDAEPVEVGPFEFEFVRVSHSIPDCVAIAVHTEHGTIFHTGDLKLDSSPLDGVATDLGHIAELGGDGVALYLADSTQADVPGHTPSERTLAAPLRDIVKGADGRVVVTCFSSHIHRIQQFCDIAMENGRKVCMVGRSMLRNTNIARNLGYMDIGGVELVKPGAVGDIDARELLVLCTGSQGEPLAAMNRIAYGTHPAVQPDPHDTVIFSSRTIPGNEIRVHRVINQLSRLGAHILHSGIAPVHVSGHASSEELKTLLQLVRPRAFMPIHGEWRHLRAHADLARMVGVQGDILLGANGTVVELFKGRASLSGEEVPVGQRLVDRHSNEDIVQRVMDDRQQLSGDGLLVVVAHELSGSLEVISRGFIIDDDALLDEARQAAEEAIDELHQTRHDPGELEHTIQEAVSSTVRERTRRSPLVVPVVLGD